MKRSKKKKPSTGVISDSESENEDRGNSPRGPVISDSSDEEPEADPRPSTRSPSPAHKDYEAQRSEVTETSQDQDEDMQSVVDSEDSAQVSGMPRKNMIYSSRIVMVKNILFLTH